MDNDTEHILMIFTFFDSFQVYSQVNPLSTKAFYLEFLVKRHQIVSLSLTH